MMKKLMMVTTCAALVAATSARAYEPWISCETIFSLEHESFDCTKPETYREQGDPNNVNDVIRCCKASALRIANDLLSVYKFEREEYKICLLEKKEASECKERMKYNVKKAVEQINNDAPWYFKSLHSPHR